jgi:hypothetical protein
VELTRFCGHVILSTGGVRKCRKQDPHTRRSTGARSSPWSVPGATPHELASEFERSAQTIRTWVAQAEADAGKR